MVDPEVCDTCGQPILRDQPMYTIAEPGPRHYDCQVREHWGGATSPREALRRTLDEGDALLARAKDLIRRMGDNP